jgi:murein DD-endopeptidase MepM/ murein hydrolase activator NlpD
MPYANHMPSVGPLPGPNARWPLLRDKLKKIPTASKGKDCSGRCVGARRYIENDFTKGTRCHCGVDLYAAQGDPIGAIDDGTIVNMYKFYKTTWAIFVNHGDYVINYGEVDYKSIAKYELKIGGKIGAGNQIAVVGKGDRDSMLHIEMWQPGTKQNMSWADFPNGSPPAQLLDITNFLRSLAGQPLISPTETLVTDPCR